MAKRVLPILHKADGPLERPFLLNWALPDSAHSLEGSTSKAEDTCFSEVISSISLDKASETVTSTQSGIDPGELVDTSF